MNGVHDMGGMHGFGKVIVEADEPSFHEPWEGRVLALSRAMMFARAWNIDMFRDSQERLPAAVYLSVSYYYRWLLGMTQSALEKGYVTQDELDAGHSQHPAKPLQRILRREDIDKVVVRPPFECKPTRAALFRPGDRVRTRNINPTGHTRLPRYARGKQGRVEAIRGFHIFPDSVVAGNGDDPQWLYTVVFDAGELWGAQADPSMTLSIEAFEPYLSGI